MTSRTAGKDDLEYRTSLRMQQQPTRSTLALLTALVTWRESEQLALERRRHAGDSPSGARDDRDSVEGADQPEQLTSQIYRALAGGRRNRRKRGNSGS